MPKQKVSREYIVHESLKLFRLNSYHNTTMADIADACGLLKGSIYHHFKGKEDLMKAVMIYVHKFFKDQVFIHAYDRNLTPKERLTKMNSVAEHVFLGPEGGDLMGNVGLETAHVNPEFSGMIQIFFKDYIKALKAIYAENMDDQQAQTLAEQGIAELEGALMLSRIFKKKDCFIKATERLEERLEVYQTNVWQKT